MYDDPMLVEDIINELRKMSAFAETRRVVTL
jgi:hypothetical protein